MYVYIIGDNPVKLWGLRARQRLQRELARRDAVTIVDDLAGLPDDAPVAILRSDYLFDSRVLDGLLATADVILEIAPAGQSIAVAAHTRIAQAQQALAILRGNDIGAESALRRVTVAELAEDFTSRQWLLKSSPPFVLPIAPARQRSLENRLYAESYKTVTDLVTKWLWPIPARGALRLCVRFGVGPNPVTLLSLVLVLAVIALFLNGNYGWGLAAAVVMTFLDTVDGKLARVTVTSTRLGGLFDHGIDLIHPPLWYIAWGIGLGEFNTGGLELSLGETLWIMLGGYIIGRAVEGVFQWQFAGFSLFIWRPFDSYFRLITARRNPNLLLLLAGAAAARADLGLVAVSLWTFLTSLVLVLRLCQAWWIHTHRGALSPWFQEIGRSVQADSLAARLFVRSTT